MKSNKLSVLLIGADVTSNGGIASVLKTYLATNEKNFNSVIEYHTLKTSHYKDKNLIFEILQLISALFTFLIVIAKYKIDIVHIHSSGSLSFYRKCIFFTLSRILQKRIIFHLHASNFYAFFLNKKGIQSFIFNYVFNNADRVVVINKDWERILKAEYPCAQIIILYNPVSFSDEENETLLPPSISSEIKILFMGFFIESKGIADLIRVADEFRNNPKCKFIVCGKGDMEEIVIKYSKENKNFLYYGWVQGKTKTDLLENSDILILPSYNEGLPIVILEAMVYKLIIISTNIAGIPELVEHSANGFLCKPGDIKALIGFINKILQMESVDILKMKKDSLNRVQRFKSEVIFKELLEIYYSI